MKLSFNLHILKANKQSTNSFLSASFCSAVHPKAEGGATAGAWTNTGNLCPATTAGSGARRSATTWRANERTEGRRVDGEKRDKKIRGEGIREREKERKKEPTFALACSFL